MTLLRGFGLESRNGVNLEMLTMLTNSALPRNRVAITPRKKTRLRDSANKL
jgi:hypothetical protein